MLYAPPMRITATKFLLHKSFRIASITLCFALGLTLMACSKQSAPAPSPQPSQPPSPSPQTATPAAPAVPTGPVIPAGWTVFSSPKGGFTIAYPKNVKGMTVNTTGSGFNLDLPDDFEPKTNAGSATLTVGSTHSKSDLAQCMKPDDTGPDAVPAKNVTLNGAPFTVFSSSDGGVGSFRDTTSYRSLHAGQCYRVEYTTSYANIHNFDPDDHIHETKDKAGKFLQSVVETFQFQQ